MIYLNIVWIIGVNALCPEIFLKTSIDFRIQCNNLRGCKRQYISRDIIQKRCQELREYLKWPCFQHWPFHGITAMISVLSDRFCCGYAKKELCYSINDKEITKTYQCMKIRIRHLWLEQIIISVHYDCSDKEILSFKHIPIFHWFYW